MAFGMHLPAVATGRKTAVYGKIELRGITRFRPSSKANWRLAIPRFGVRKYRISADFIDPSAFIGSLYLAGSTPYAPNIF